MDWYSNQSLTDSRCGRYCNRLSARFGGETPVCFTNTRVKTVFSLLPNPNFFGTRPDLKDVVSDLNRNCRSLSMYPPHSISRCICGHAGEAPLTGDLTAANRRGCLSSLRFNSAKPNKRPPHYKNVRSNHSLNETLKTKGFRKPTLMYD